MLAPHADDEMIGCGGWLILTREHPVKRVVVFCTQWDLVRKTEAETACFGLSLDGIKNLNLPERSISEGSHHFRTAIIELAKLVEDLSPAYIFVPSLRDPHPDHRLTNRLLHQTLSQLCTVPTILQYEGFVPLGDANWWLDISKIIDEKRHRLEAYQSQDKRYGIVNIITHLNAYRGITLFRRTITHAEAYKQMSTQEYLSCVNRLDS